MVSIRTWTKPRPDFLRLSSRFCEVECDGYVRRKRTPRLPQAYHPKPGMPSVSGAGVRDTQIGFRGQSVCLLSLLTTPRPKR